MRTGLNRFLLVSFLAALILALGQPVGAMVKPGQEVPKPSIIKGKLTVQFTEDVVRGRVARGFGSVSVGIPSVDQVLNQVQASDIHPIFTGISKTPPRTGDVDLSGFYEIAIPENADLQATINELMQNPYVKLAEPVWEMYVDAVPNDLQWANQWHMEPPGPDPNIYTAWDTETGSDSIKIAIIDTGVLYSHADLNKNIWVNPGEDIDGDGAAFDTGDENGVDDDGNGFVDDLIGWDFVLGMSSFAPGEDCCGRDNKPTDFNGHGTHVAGIVAAVNNNGIDVTGMAGGWQGGHRSKRGCAIMCVRAGGERADGLGTLSQNDIAAAVDYARLMGAHVINASFGGGSYSVPMAGAIANAVNAGISYIHSAGNENTTIEGWQDQIPGVVTVAATYSSDQKWTWNSSAGSNYGLWITVSAPGQDILSTVSDHYAPGLAAFTGTSMAAPCVAGLNGLVRSMMPSLSREEVDSIITNTTDNIDAANPGYEGMLGTGRINAVTALSGLADAKFTSSATDGNIPHTVNFTDQSPNSPTTWDWSFGDGGTSTDQNPSHLYATPGVYDVSLKVTEPRGLGEEHLDRYVWARADTMIIDSLSVIKGQLNEVGIYLNNSAAVKTMLLALKMPSPSGAYLNNFEVAGTRSENFDFSGYNGGDGLNTFGIELRSTPEGTHNYLNPGSGDIVKLFVYVPWGAPTGEVITIDTMTLPGNKKPVVGAVLADYWPVFKAGKLVVKDPPCCEGTTGNVDMAGIVNSLDLGYLIQYLTPPAGPVLDCPEEANINGVGIINSLDLSYLIQYLTPPPGPALPACP